MPDTGQASTDPPRVQMQPHSALQKMPCSAPCTILRQNITSNAVLQPECTSKWLMSHMSQPRWCHVAPPPSGHRYRRQEMQTFVAIHRPRPAMPQSSWLPPINLWHPCADTTTTSLRHKATSGPCDPFGGTTQCLSSYQHCCFCCCLSWSGCQPWQRPACACSSTSTRCRQ